VKGGESGGWSLGKTLRLIGELGSIAQGVALIFGALALVIGYAQALPWPVTLALMMAAVGIGLIAGGAIINRTTRPSVRDDKPLMHEGAPFIAWAYPNTSMRDDGSIAVHVYCENAGPRDSEAVVITYFAESSRADEQFLVPELPWSRILSRRLGDQHRFMVSFNSVPPEKPLFGEREIEWGMMYFDGANRERVYITKASIKADYQEVGPAHITEQWMDATSTVEERHERWLSKTSPLHQQPR
jgi:hypothetical protein